jgi:hypothetical protein
VRGNPRRKRTVQSPSQKDGFRRNAVADGVEPDDSKGSRDLTELSWTSLPESGP